MNGQRRRMVTRDAMMWGAAFLLALAQWRHVAFFFDRDLIRAVEAAKGVLAGYPHWRVYQARLLGPWAADSLSLFGLNLVGGHMVVAVAALGLSGVAIFQAGRAVCGRQGGWTALLYFHVLFSLLMSRPWLYVWDYFILLTGAVFMLLAVRRAPWWAFLLLMVPAFLNHESAVFIGVYMLVQAVADWRRRPQWGMALGGLLGSLAGLAAVEHLRTALLRREIGPEIFADAVSGGSHVHVQLAMNLDSIIQWVTAPGVYVGLLVPVTLAVAMGLAGLLLLRRRRDGAGLAAYAMAQVAALVAFALLAETRVLLQLVPFLSIGGLLAARED